MTPIRRQAPLSNLRWHGAGRGFSIVELMVAMTISLFLMLGLVSLFVNTSRSGRELAKTNVMIDGGRAASQILQNDIQHAAFWGGYVPQFDDFTSTSVPADVPTDPLPSPCQAYSTWDSNYVRSVVALPVLAYEVLPTGTGCVALPSTYPQHANTDVIIIRHLEVCVPGAPNCDADTPGSLYFQTSFCAAEQSAGSAQGGSSTSITLSSGASSTTGAYVGVMLHTLSGTGSGQFRQISAYDGSTHVATVSTAWTVVPDTSTTYALAYELGTSSFPLHKRDCVGTGTPATLPITAGTISDKHKFLSDLYYIADYPNPDYPAQLVPTLMRSRFDLSGGTLAHQTPVPLIDGVEGFKVVLGIDNVSKSGAAVDYTQAINWQDPTNLVLPTNRGDGAPDQYIRCTGAGGCTAAQLINVVAVKLYILVRDRDTTPGYTDTKTYCLGEPNADGTCPAASQYTPGDNYKRHLFITTIRVNNVSQRRETPS
jgi:type II secretory pathway pseudopilin PulG